MWFGIASPVTKSPVKWAWNIWGKLGRFSDPIVLAHSAHSHNTLRCYRTVVKQSTDVTVANPEWGSGSLSPNPLQTFGFFISLVRHQSSCKYRITNFSQLEVSKIALSLNFFSLFWLQIEKIVKKINVSWFKVGLPPLLFKLSMCGLCFMYRQRKKKCWPWQWWRQ